LPQSGDCDRAEQPRSALAKRLQPRHTVSPTEQGFVFVAACFFSVYNGPCHENHLRFVARKRKTINIFESSCSRGGSKKKIRKL
jgi:hypothetical protein